MEQYAPNIKDRVTLTDYVNLEATQRGLQPSDLWKKVQTEPISIETIHFALIGNARDGAVKRFNKAASQYGAVVNVEETSEVSLASIWNYYSIRGLGVNLRD